MDISFIVIIFQFIIYAIIAEYIKLIINIIFIVVVSIYCNIIVSRLKDFWDLKQKVYKYLYYLKTTKTRYNKLQIISNKIFEVSLDLGSLNHKFSEQTIGEISDKINGYLNTEDLNTITISSPRGIFPSYSYNDPHQVMLIDKNFLEDSLKTVKKLKPTLWVIIIPI